jgi:hypothetical protein
LQQKAGHRSGKCPGFSPAELRVAFSIPPGSLFLVNQPVCSLFLAYHNMGCVGGGFLLLRRRVVCDSPVSVGRCLIFNNSNPWLFVTTDVGDIAIQHLF